MKHCMGIVSMGSSVYDDQQGSEHGIFEGKSR